MNVRLSVVYSNLGSLQSECRPDIPDILPHPSGCDARAPVPDLWNCGHNGFRGLGNETSERAYTCFLLKTSDLHPGM
jgi:hypothetical protein